MTDRSAALAFGLVSERGPQGSLFSLRDELEGGRRATTYGRDWVMTEPKDMDGALVHGRIGIVTGVDVWDPQTNQFAPGQVEAGQATPYVLNTDSGLVVFQTRGSVIKAQSFVNAFEHLLNGKRSRWRVTLAEREMAWEEFLRRVERIDRLSVRVDYPNPRFRSQEARDLVEGAHAASATVTWRAAEGESIDNDADVVNRLMEHAEDYGQYTAQGPASDGGRIRWRSRRRRAQITATAPADPETGEVEPDELAQASQRLNEVPFFPEDETGDD